MIAEFSGKYALLSNSTEGEVAYDVASIRARRLVPAAKCEKAEDRVRFEHLATTDAKRLGRKVAFRDGWEDIKDDIMLGHHLRRR